MMYCIRFGKYWPQILFELRPKLFELAALNTYFDRKSVLLMRSANKLTKLLHTADFDLLLRD